jgi:predicted dehydrogenase
VLLYGKNEFDRGNLYINGIELFCSCTKNLRLHFFIYGFLMNRVLRVGIAGYGIVGKRRAGYINKRSDMKLVSICERNLTNYIYSDHDVSFYSNYKEMVDSEKLDVLFVCLTNDIAPDATIFGLEAGLHVFCEKPPGRSVSDIENVIQVESRYPELKLMYGFNHRYHNSVQDTMRLIKSGEFGKIINLRGVYGKAKLITFTQDDWRTKMDVAGGGVLLDQGIHMVDLMRLFAGDFVNIHSFISNNFWEFDVEDNAYALMKTNDGVIGMLHSSATQWRHRFSLDINLSKGSINLSGILSSSKSYGAETLTVVYANPENDCGDPKEVTTRYNIDPSWHDEIEEFSDCIINNRKITTGTSDDALQTMKIVHKIYCADKEWRQNDNIEGPNTYE